MPLHIYLVKYKIKFGNKWITENMSVISETKTEALEAVKGSIIGVYKIVSVKLVKSK